MIMSVKTYVRDNYARLCMYQEGLKSLQQNEVVPI